MKSLKGKFNHYLTVLVHSFTWQTLILSLINWDSSQIDSHDVLQFFAVSVAITVLMAITDIFTFKCSLPIIILADLLDIAVVVFGLGGYVFKWFEFEWQAVLPVIGVIILIYFVIFGFLMLQMKKDSEHINIKIKEKFGKENSDNE